MGYHLATADEFRTFLGNTNWTAKPGLVDQWSFASGFNFVEDAKYVNGVRDLHLQKTTTNLLPRKFNDRSPSYDESISQTVKGLVTGWVDDGSGNLMVGAQLIRTDILSSCANTYIGFSYTSRDCTRSITYTADAILASSYDDLYAGSYSTDYSSELSRAGIASVSYYMVTNAPEPGTMGLMLLGLAGAVTVARRRRA